MELAGRGKLKGEEEKALELADQFQASPNIQLSFLLSLPCKFTALDWFGPVHSSEPLWWWLPSPVRQHKMQSFTEVPDLLLPFCLSTIFIDPGERGLCPERHSGPPQDMPLTTGQEVHENKRTKPYTTTSWWHSTYLELWDLLLKYLESSFSTCTGLFSHLLWGCVQCYRCVHPWAKE